MRPPTYMLSVVGRNVVMWRMTVQLLQLSASGQVAVRKRENDSTKTVEVGRRKRKLNSGPRQNYRETALPRSKLRGTVVRESDMLCSDC